MKSKVELQEDVVIRFTDVEQTRPHFRLGPLNLAVPRGYVTAIVGPNGSGKSSTFRLMLNMAKPDRGHIEMIGREVNKDDIEVKQRIGYLPENANHGEHAIRGTDKADFVKAWYPGWDVNRYQELLRRFEVDPSLKLGKMSKGMRRKFDLSLVLAHQPELLLLDEPSSGLDPLAWKVMIEVLHRYMEHGNRTIVLASHIIDEIKRLADYIVFMAEGHVIGVYEKDELLSSWHTFYVKGGRAVFERLARVPGLQSREDVGGMQVRAVTNKALEAEEWIRGEGMEITGRTAMELDDIMASLIKNDRLQKT
ncbi:ATP-binding cassette domain-containing protein [Paenibacillus tarimensis]